MTRVERSHIDCIALKPYPKDFDPALAQQICQHWLKVVQLNWQGVVVIGWVSPEEMANLNEQHTGLAKPTDVLSFRYDPPLLQPGTQELVYGEIVICPAIAEDFANQHNLSMRDEILTLVTHGLLHLAGFDHSDADQRHRFETLTRGIMNQEGIEPVSLWLV